MRYAILNGETVTNVILWDGETPIPGSESFVSCGDIPVGPGWLRVNDDWVAPEPDEPEEPEQSYSELRQAAYIAESDPLFFKWQRGEATEQEWLDKVQEIRERYPHVENDE